MLKRLLASSLAKYKRELVLVLMLQTVQATAGLYLPRLNASIIDNGILKRDTGYIWSTGSLMLLASLGQIAFSIAAVYYGSRAAMGFGRDVRGKLFHQVTGYSAKEVAQFGAPSLITRITNDVQQVQTLVQMSCTLLIAAPITMIGGIIMAIRQDAGLSSLLLVSVPVLSISVGIIIARMVPQFRFMQERIDKINQVLREQIVGIRVVRAFVREPNEVKRFAAANAQLTETGLRAGNLQAFMFPTVMFLFNASTIAAVWIGADRVSSGETQVGALVAFLSYIAQILMSIMTATFIIMMIPRAAVCAERINEVLDTPSSVVAPDDPVTDFSAHGTLEFRNVSFHYPGAAEPVLTNISFTAAPGQTTAIVGSTGSGKTTLINLVPRLFDATSGMVLVDGVDVRDVDPEILWSRVGLVPQKPYLFSGTVASNLRYADPDATDAQLWESLEVAQATAFVTAMPDQLDAQIAQGGASVSGGQRQRLAIARALVRKPEIFLFDDSFSALDLATDAQLRAALVPHTRDATVIIVAQRISTIATADQIIVLEDGHQVGLGTHQSLMESCATYREIVESQISEQAA